MNSYKYLKDNGRYQGNPMSIRDFFAILGLEDSLATDKAAGGGMYGDGV
jgi:hypothetical protein